MLRRYATQSIKLKESYIYGARIKLVHDISRFVDCDVYSCYTKYSTIPVDYPASVFNQFSFTSTSISYTFAVIVLM